ncbi:bZIP transcription factor TGA10-like isoform X5 [Juglans regia]|uniref:BZIP transcription factor TGA10-like isoform X5 n=1 Tax=Juglans regia TaxID=51240 RepID=A0A6P9E915_JUGRE|nr:bZIP transcription factor TGA10-like isoform X5 [Juglans regia]
MASNIKATSHQTQVQRLQHHHRQQHQPQHQHQTQDHHQFPYGMMQPSSSSSFPENFIRSKDSGAYDLGELDQALFLYLDEQDPSTLQDQRRFISAENQGMRPPTLNIFPSQPMHVEPPSTKASTGLVSPATSGSKRPSGPLMELANARNDAPSGHEPAKAMKLRGGSRKGPTSSSEQEGPKTPDPKTLRRLAQNREAARKSRLRKKAYVQQLESSRIKLTQLEQELQRARAQGIFFGGESLLGGEQGFPLAVSNISSDAAVFDMEYARWLEEHHRITCELRAAVQEHLPENDLRLFVDNFLAHFDEAMNLKSMVAKTDVFHLVSGMWKTPAERCFLWIGGFKPSELIKEAEDALSQGLQALNQSLVDTITSDSLSSPPNMANYMGQMALAMNKLSTVEGFVRQADNLRHQTIHRLHQFLTTRQAARCFLAIAEYFHRLRALSSLWLARPRQE